MRAGKAINCGLAGMRSPCLARASGAWRLAWGSSSAACCGSCRCWASGCCRSGSWCCRSTFIRCAGRAAASKRGGEGCAENAEPRRLRKKGRVVSPAPRRWVMVGCLQGKTRTSCHRKVNKSLTRPLNLVGTPRSTGKSSDFARIQGKTTRHVAEKRPRQRGASKQRLFCVRQTAQIGGLARNRTGVQGFAVLCVTTPPSGPGESGVFAVWVCCRSSPDSL